MATPKAQLPRRPWVLKAPDGHFEGFPSFAAARSYVTGLFNLPVLVSCRRLGNHAYRIDPPLDGLEVRFYGPWVLCKEAPRRRRLQGEQLDLFTDDSASPVTHGSGPHGV